MKKTILGLAVLTLALGMPFMAMANDASPSTFFATQNLLTEETSASAATAVTSMDDAALASVEGGQIFELAPISLEALGFTLDFTGLTVTLPNGVLPPTNGTNGTNGGFPTIPTNGGF